MMNDREALEIVRACMTDELPLVVHISVMDAWLLVSAIQLATRHPELSVYTKDSLFSTARQFQARIEEAHPNAREFLEMGWDTAFDGVDSLDEMDGVIPDADDSEFEIFSDLDDDEDNEFDGYGDYE